MNKGKISITRPSYGDGRSKISITVKDADAVVRFLDIEIDLDKFAECITGLSEIDCEIETRSLDAVGRIRERMDIVFELPTESYNMKKDEICEIAKQNTPEGWVCSDYFGSQNSFFKRGGKQYARTSALRWVEKESK